MHRVARRPWRGSVLAPRRADHVLRVRRVLTAIRDVLEGVEPLRGAAFGRAAAEAVALARLAASLHLQTLLLADVPARHELRARRVGLAAFLLRAAAPIEGGFAGRLGKQEHAAAVRRDLLILRR